MSSNRWFTKQDILNDLTEVTGARVTNIDDRFAVSGKRPPPVNVPEEDENEFVQMYGQYNSIEMKAAEPDLSGITHMVRMNYLEGDCASLSEKFTIDYVNMEVNDYYEGATYEDYENIKELKKDAKTVISISKLDPNVAEFIPKTESKQKNVANMETTVKIKSSDIKKIRNCSSKNVDVKPLVCKNDNEIHKTDSSHKIETNDNDIDVTKKIDVSSLNSSEIKDLRKKLKEKIVCTAKTKCLNKKRERNLAMASLLKLHTDVPDSSKNDASPSLKLMTPDYFQIFPENVKNNSNSTKVKADKIEENVKEEIKEIIIKKVVKLSSDTAPESRSSPMTTSRESLDLDSNIKSDSNLEKQRIDSLLAREREESVKKVNKWFDGPENKKHKPRICFGPVTFKKKDSTSANSSETQSNSITDITEGPSISSHTSDSFVPSAYANELTRSYMERSQSTVVQHEDIWTKLERELREKDRLLAKKTQK